MDRNQLEKATFCSIFQKRFFAIESRESGELNPFLKKIYTTPWYKILRKKNQPISAKIKSKYFRFGFIFYPCLRISSTTWIALYVPSVCFWYITIYIYYLVYDRAQTLCRLWYVIFKWKLYRRTQVCSRTSISLAKLGVVPDAYNCS